MLIFVYARLALLSRCVCVCVCTYIYVSTFACIYEYHQKTTAEGVSEPAVQCLLVSNRCVASATANCLAVQPLYDEGPAAGSQK